MSDNMVVTAAMCYYDDDLELLDRTLRGLPVVADRLVVADGRFERYEPGGPAASPKTHRDFIKQVCKEVGLPVKIDIPAKPYLGQVQKRARLLGLAQPGSDWVFGVDADHICHGIRSAIRYELDQPDVDSFEVQYYVPMNRARPLSESAAGQWHASLAGDYHTVAAFWRAWPGLTCKRYHWWYSAMKNGTETWLWGGDIGPIGHIKQLKAPFVIEHACLFRQERHILANRAFCEDREQLVKLTGYEDPVEAAA